MHGGLNKKAWSYIQWLVTVAEEKKVKCWGRGVERKEVLFFFGHLG
jgi:hypothetical protein